MYAVEICAMQCIALCNELYVFQPHRAATVVLHKIGHQYRYTLFSEEHTQIMSHSQVNIALQKHFGLICEATFPLFHKR